MATRFLDRSIRGAAVTALTILAATLIGLGVPGLWFWIGGHIQAASVHHLRTTTVAAILPGIVISYVLLMALAAWAAEKWFSQEDDRAGAHRASWLRSMRDEPHTPRTLSPVERIFVLASVIATIAYLIWLVGFAGPPPSPVTT